MHDTPIYGLRKSGSTFGCLLYCMLLTGYAVLAAGTPYIFRSMHHLIPSLLCSCDLALVVLSGIFQKYFDSQVKNIRLQGYYKFSKKLKHIAHLPFTIAAYGTAVMLFIVVWRPHVSTLSETALLRITMAVEAVSAGFFMSIYIVYLLKYNSFNSQPDILNALYSPLQQSNPLEYMRLSDQQMALLQYQRENIHFLSEEIIHLQECLSKYEQSNDGSTSQVDLAHLLAAREQELRTMTAEVNQLQSDLRIAKSLLNEKDSDIQRAKTTNKQHVQENERLRAILGEWSTRAAKLERALEAERVSIVGHQKKPPESPSRNKSGQSQEHSS